MSERDVILYEVGPRDGLQNEPDTVPTDVKRELLDYVTFHEHYRCSWRAAA